MLNGPAQNHRMAIPALPCGVVLWCIVRFFLTFNRKFWKVVPNHQIWVSRGMTSLRQAVGKVMKKYWLHFNLIFTFYFNQSHIGAGNIPFRCISLKTAFQSVCVDPLTCNWNCLSNYWFAVERSRMTFISIHIIANQISYHDDKSTKQYLTRIFCPQLIDILTVLPLTFWLADHIRLFVHYTISLSSLCKLYLKRLNLLNACQI